MSDRDSTPEEIGNDKPQSFYEGEEARQRFEAGLEAALRERGSLSERIGDGLDHGRQDENHRPDQPTAID